MTSRELRIEHLEQRVRDLQDELARAKLTLAHARAEDFTLRTGVREGTVINGPRARSWRVSRITAGDSPTALFGHRKTKSGWHKSEQWIGFYSANTEKEIDIVSQPDEDE